MSDGGNKSKKGGNAAREALWDLLRGAIDEVNSDVAVFDTTDAAKRLRGVGRPPETRRQPKPRTNGVAE